MSKINYQWYPALASVALLVLMMFIFDYGWQYGLSLEASNTFGLMVFATIMAGGPLAYIGSRIIGARGKTLLKIGLLVPFLWLCLNKLLWHTSSSF